MIITLACMIIAWAIAKWIKNSLFQNKYSPKLKQVVVILTFFISMLSFWLLYLDASLDVDSPLFKAFFDKMIMDSVLVSTVVYFTLDPFDKWGSKNKNKNNQVPPNNQPKEEDEYIIMTLKDNQPLGDFILSQGAINSLIAHHKKTVNKQFHPMFNNLSESERQDLARRILREFQDEYQNIDTKLKATELSLKNTSNNTERQILANVLQQFIALRSNIETIASNMDIPIDILNGSKGVAHNSYKKRVKKGNIQI